MPWREARNYWPHFHDKLPVPLRCLIHVIVRSIAEDIADVTDFDPALLSQRR
jgi:hypothetical protein